MRDVEVSEKLVRKVVLAALGGERERGGWIKIDAPDSSEKEISLAIMEASQRGWVEACDVTSMDSDYPEWKLSGPTGLSTSVLREARFWNRLGLNTKVVIGGIIAFLAWLIPVLISLYKKP